MVVPWMDYVPDEVEDQGVPDEVEDQGVPDEEFCKLEDD